MLISTSMNNDNTNIEQNEKVMAALGYLWILCLIPLLFKRDSQFAQFHGKQGLMLFFLEILLSFAWIIPFAGIAIFFIGWVFVIIFMLYGILKVTQGVYWKMPILGALAENIEI